MDIVKKIVKIEFVKSIRKSCSYKNIKQNFYDIMQLKDFKRRMNELNISVLYPSKKIKKTILINGNEHEIIWAVRWMLLVFPLIRDGYDVIVLTRKTSKIQNKYYKILGCNSFYFIDDFFKNKLLNKNQIDEIEKLTSTKDLCESIKKYTYNHIPIGRISISGMSRYQLIGNIDFSKEAMRLILRNMLMKNMIFAVYVRSMFSSISNIELYLTSEAFHDEYGVFYYYMLNNGENIVKTNLSVMDNCFLAQKRTLTNDGMHHNDVEMGTYNKIFDGSLNNYDEYMSFFLSNIQDRYSGKWHLSKRNYKNTEMLNREAIINEYDIDADKRIVIIFSHILYDTLYFFEDELYENYSKWLIDTVRIAIENKSVNWLIKIHPSNMWRGEINDRNYEEISILEAEFGELPEHIKYIYPDSIINPLTFIKYADIGITVRGTIGMEMPCYGNKVITCSAGRYTQRGFTLDPETVDEYRNYLLNVQHLDKLDDISIRKAISYYYAIFKLKPICMDIIKPVVRRGFSSVSLLGSLYPELVKGITQSNDKYIPVLEDFSSWAIKSKSVDLLSEI